MKILSNSPVQESSSRAKNDSPKEAREIAGTSTGGRKIVRRNAPSQSMSADEVRDKIEKMKLKKIAKANIEKAEKSQEKHFSTEMLSTREIKAEKIQDAKRKKLEIAKKAAMTKTQGESKAPAKSEEETATKEKQEAKVVDASGNPIKSDVSKNDPTDPNVREKLKEILATGAFSFNQKEKGALSAILNSES